MKRINSNYYFVLDPGFLYNPKNKTVLLHHRDGNTRFNPNKWAFFGGLVEGEETPIEGFIRELYEEINLKVEQKDIRPLHHYFNDEFKTMRYVFFIISDADISTLKLGEGAGFEWVRLSDINKYDLTEKTKKDLDYFIQKCGVTN